MNTKVYQDVCSRADGYCEHCGKWFGERLELHHILRRKIQATKDNCLMLCQNDHRGKAGVHGMLGHNLDIYLKKQLQEFYFNQGNNEDEVRKLMCGRIY